MSLVTTAIAKLFVASLLAFNHRGAWARDRLRKKGKGSGGGKSGKNNNMVAPYLLWETRKWDEQGFTNSSAVYDFDELREALEDLSNENNQLGVTATIFDVNGDQVFQETFGEYYCQGPFNMINLFNVDVTCQVGTGPDNYVTGWDEDTQIAVYSNSKVVSAMVFMAAVGSEYLDEPLMYSLPDIFNSSMLDDERKKMITPRQILSHSSGIAFEYRYDETVFDKCFARFDDIVRNNTENLPQPSLEDCVEFIAFELDLVWAPGTYYEYSDIAFDILALLVQEKTGGMTFEDAFRTYVADPIGLTDQTTFDCPLSQSTAAHAHPAIGLCSTGVEFPKIVQVLAKKGMTPSGTQIIKPEDIEEILQPQTKSALLWSPNTFSDFLIRSPNNGLFSARCRPVPAEKNGVSQIAYGLGAFRNTGTKAENWQHPGLMGSKWFVAEGLYSAFFSLSYPFSYADPLLYRVLDRFDRKSSFEVTPPGCDEPVELPICSGGAWLVDPKEKEELPVNSPYFELPE